MRTHVMRSRIVCRLEEILVRTSGTLTVCVLMTTPQSLAQVPPGAPKFEVASIRPASGCEDNGGRAGSSRSRSSPGRLILQCQTVDGLIRDAYLLYGDGKPWPVPIPGGPPLPLISARFLNQQIKGSPAWVRSDRYSIEAITKGTPREELMRGPMLQALLQERFKLKIHRETREV